MHAWNEQGLKCYSRPPPGSNISLSRQVNETVLTDVQGNGQIASASDISPPYPSQRSISLPAGNKCRKEITRLLEGVHDSQGGKRIKPKLQIVHVLLSDTAMKHS